MSPKRKYDLDSVWEDPLDRREVRLERREGRRMASQFKVHVAKAQAGSKKSLVAEGLIENISVGGVLFKTRHRLQAGEYADLAIPTGREGKAAGLPKAFLTRGSVLRVSPYREDISVVAVEFDAALRWNMEFALFIERVLALAKAGKDENLQLND